MEIGGSEDLFFLDLLDGRTKALLSSTPFSMDPSDLYKQKSQGHRMHDMQVSKMFSPLDVFLLPLSSTTTSVFSSSADGGGSLCCRPFQLCFFLSFPILNLSL